MYKFLLKNRNSEIVFNLDCNDVLRLLSIIIMLFQLDSQKEQSSLDSVEPLALMLSSIMTRRLALPRCTYDVIFEQADFAS